ncbi:MAG: caspase family protein [Saprospiraceae bacterium]|nr:caspase family protein [Saprospiraceae bacterium]
MKPTLHALLIAISKYPHKDDCLSGPAYDITQIQEHLTAFCEKNDFEPPVFHPLENEAATRQGIIDAYQHFLKAKKGDTCLVYYSGHGYRLKAHPAFSLDSNGMHEALYSYDAGDKDKWGLLDKELAYLGWKYVEQQNKNLHFVEIFDCCHAGGITRAPSDNKVKARSRQSAMGIRLNLEDYLGYKEYSGYEAYAANGKGFVQAPVAKRIQMAAAKSVETAKERDLTDAKGNVAGYFTTGLCRALKTADYQLSYSELLDKTWFKVKEYALVTKSTSGDQSPLMDTEQQDPYGGFLTGKPMAVNRSYAIGYNRMTKQWEMRAGEAMGIPAVGKTTIKIDGDDATYQLGTVYSDVSSLTLPNTYKQGKVYAATIHEMEWEGKLKLAHAPNTPIKAREAFDKAYKVAFMDSKPMYVEWTDDAEAANFHLVYEDGAYYMVEKGSKKPLFKRCNLEQLPAFFGNAEKAAKWFFLSKLNNPDPEKQITEDDVEISMSLHWDDVFQRQPKPVNWRETVTCEYSLDKGKYYYPGISLSVKNKSKEPLWVSIVWLNADYSIDTHYIPSGKVEIAFDEVAHMVIQDKDDWKKVVWASIPKVFHQYNVSEVSEYLKVFVSTKDLGQQINSYKQALLPLDVAYFKGNTRGGGSGSMEELAVENKEKWSAFTIPLRIVKPLPGSKIGENGQGAQVYGQAITVPSGFSGDVVAATQGGGTRAAGIPVPTALADSDIVQPYNIAGGIANGATNSVLKFTGVTGKELVTPESPIRVGLQAIANNEMVFSVGYDAETGMYYPVGYETGKQLVIEELPDEMSEGQRSLGGSIVLYLKKVVLETFKIKPDSVYKLSLAKLPDDLEEDAKFDPDLPTVRNAVTGAKRILLCTHGIIGDTKDMVKFVKRIELDQPYDLVLAFDYENLDTEIEEIAAQLKQKLADVGLKEGHGKVLHVVAHSMGGLVSRWFVEQLEGSKVVSHLILVGTPNNGSQWATVAQFVSVGLSYAMNFLELAKPVQMLLSFLGKYGDRALTSLRQMHPDSEFMQKLNGNVVPVPIPYSIIAGDVLSVRSDAEKSFFEKLFLRVKQTVAKPLFGEANDIACTVKSINGVMAAKLSDPIACDHLSYFVDEKGLKALEGVLKGI